MTRWTKHHQVRRNEYNCWLTPISTDTISFADIERWIKEMRERPPEPFPYQISDEVRMYLNK